MTSLTLDDSRSGKLRPRTQLSLEFSGVQLMQNQAKIINLESTGTSSSGETTQGFRRDGKRKTCLAGDDVLPEVESSPNYMFGFQECQEGVG